MCPFEYDLMPQNKVHISEKEISDGETVESVYGKK